MQNCRVRDSHPGSVAPPVSRRRRCSLVGALLVVLALLAIAGCGSSEAEAPIIAASDEEALAEDVQNSEPGTGSGGDSSEPPLDPDSVDEVVPDGELAIVEFVPDGDTIQLDDGRRVRLLQIDTPEGGEGQECYAEAARDTLRAFVSEGSEILLVADPLTDQEDRFGRLLRYVYFDEVNVNIELVQRGAATVWFVGGVEGIFSEELLAAATEANAASRGLWGVCPGTPLDPSRGADTGPR